jgi:hypothetical protein
MRRKDVIGLPLLLQASVKDAFVSPAITSNADVAEEALGLGK